MTNSPEIKVLCLSLNSGDVPRFLSEASKSHANVPRIAFIGTAGNVYDDAHFVNDDRIRLTGMGFELVEADVSAISNQKFLEILNNTDAVFVAGGNTFFLLQELRRTGNFELLQSAILEGKPYIGASAGCVILSRNISYVEDIDDRVKGGELQSDEGLGILNFSPMPHYGNPKYLQKYHDALLNNPDLEIVLLRDNQSLETTDGIQYAVRRSDAVAVD